MQHFHVGNLDKIRDAPPKAWATAHCNDVVTFSELVHPSAAPGPGRCRVFQIYHVIKRLFVRTRNRRLLSWQYAWDAALPMPETLTPSQKETRQMPQRENPPRSE